MRWVRSILIAGGGSQTGTGPFWGNYTSMTVDPADGCTFWYTNQYYPEDGAFAWVTRVGSFKFGNCTMGPSGTLEGTVTDGANPLEGAIVQAGATSTATDSAGHYELTLPVGIYTVTASKYGFFPSTVNDVEVTEGGTTTQDFTLEAAPSALVNGTVRDAQGNWPLYARIRSRRRAIPEHALDRPGDGQLRRDARRGHDLQVQHHGRVAGLRDRGRIGGARRAPGQRAVVVQNWSLEANSETCNAPGYSPDIAGLFENFSGGTMPAGWEVINNSTGGNGLYPTEWVVVEGSDPCGDYSGNLTGGDGPYAVTNSDCPGSSVVMDTTLITPSVNLSGFSSAVLRFNEDYAIPVRQRGRGREHRRRLELDERSGSDGGCAWPASGDDRHQRGGG